MQPMQSKVTSKGQVVIPKPIRERYGINTATTVFWVEKGEGVLLVPDVEDTIVTARGMFKRSGMLKKLLEEKAADKAREAKTEKLQ